MKMLKVKTELFDERKDALNGVSFLEQFSVFTVAAEYMLSIL